MEWLASLQMTLAAVAWIGAEPRRLTASDQLELVMACMLLNGSAICIWIALFDPRLMLTTWASHALAAASLTLLAQIVRTAKARTPYCLRALGPISLYLVVAGLAALWTGPAHI